LDDPAPPFEKAHRPTVTLPASAKRFVDEVYGLATEQRRADVTRQLYDAIDPAKRGARLRAGSAWAAEHAADTEAIGRKLRADFGDVSDLPDDHWKRIAHDSALATELRKASGFPDFDAWVATRQTRDASATAARSA
jgi:hypothetical protein